MKKLSFENIRGPIGFFGIGRSNLSLIAMLPRGADIVLRSDKPISAGAHREIERLKERGQLGTVKIFEGKEALRDIEEQILVVSPSVRRSRAELISAIERGVQITSDAELFFERARGSLLAVSGSSGKSTTASLAHRMLRTAKKCSLCGNIGRPMLEAIDDTVEAYVCELSSFMLLYHKAQLSRSVITNISPNHLDWHESFEEYVRAKLKLAALSRELVMSADDEISLSSLRERCFAGFSSRLTLSELIKLMRAEIYIHIEDGFICRNGERLIHKSALARREEHNIRNLMAAIALTDGYCDIREALFEAARFSGLPHRCERFLSHGGVNYINSSIDTTPERSAETLRSLGASAIVLLGGRGKGLSLDPLVEPLKKYAKAVIAFGEERKNILLALGDALTVIEAYDLGCAIKLALDTARKGDTVLLSPAHTSYDEFESFEERGEFFKSYIRDKIFEN